MARGRKKADYSRVYDDAGNVVYNVYDANSKLVFWGTQKDIQVFLGVPRTTLQNAINAERELKGYLVLDRGFMREYEMHRKNRAGYINVGRLKECSL